MEPRTGSRAQLVASCCALWQQLAARTDARVLMRVRVFSFSFVSTPYGCWVAGVGHPVSQNLKVVLSQNGPHGDLIHAKKGAVRAVRIAQKRAHRWIMLAKVRGVLGQPSR